MPGYVGLQAAGSGAAQVGHSSLSLVNRTSFGLKREKRLVILGCKGLCVGSAPYQGVTIPAGSHREMLPSFLRVSEPIFIPLQLLQ